MSIREVGANANNNLIDGTKNKINQFNGQSLSSTPARQTIDV